MVLKDLSDLTKDHNRTNSSTVDLKMLTTNIDQMIKKITNLSIVRGFSGKEKRKS